MRAHNKAWNDCPTGTISGMVRTRRAHWWKMVASKFSVISGFMFLAALVAFGITVVQPRASRLGGFNCFEVMRLADDYHYEQLDAPVRHRLESHLVSCPSCQKQYDEWRVDHGLCVNAVRRQKASVFWVGAKLLSPGEAESPDRPASDEPASDEPASDEPASDEPASDEPASNKTAHDKAAHVKNSQHDGPADLQPEDNSPDPARLPAANRPVGPEEAAR